MMFAFSSVAVAVGVGAGIDLSGAYAARQRLSQVAALTCQYSVRDSVINTQSSNAAVAANPGNTFQYYLTTVNTFATNALTAQHLNAAQVTDSSGGTSAYFTATAGANGPSGGVTDLTMNYPTAFLKIIKVTSVPVHAHITCQNAATTTQISTGPNIVVSEGFETNCTTYCFTQPSGVGGALLNPTTTYGSSPTYTGDGGFSWYVIGYCLEVDYVGVINSSDPQGTHSAELDCDNANHTAGNSSMSTRVFLNAGSYELRYFYRSRIQQSALDPYYVCGWSYNDPTKTDDLSWVNSTNFPGLGTTSQMRTNQMNVYLDQTTATAMPPLHYTNYSNTPTQQLAGSNLVDSCVYSYKWIERSVTINVSASNYFWLSFAADGQNDSFGAQLDNIRLCTGTCSGNPQDNFPDTTPQTQPSSTTQTASANSYFTNASWGNWNYYQSQNTPLCLNSSFSRCSNLSNTSDSQVLLDPGFYELTYQYYPLSTFSGAPVTGCDSTPAASNVSSMRSATVTAKSRYSAVSYGTYADVDMLGTYLSFPGQTLTPNPGGTITTASPLIDLCYYTTTSTQRKISFQITKPGLYDLAFYAHGTSSSKYLGASYGTFNSSGAPTNFSLTSLGSPFTLQTSSNCPAVPVPAPQVGSAIPGASGTGYSISSTDPFQYGASSSACTP